MHYIPSVPLDSEDTARIKTEEASMTELNKFWLNVSQICGAAFLTIWTLKAKRCVSGLWEGVHLWNKKIANDQEKWKGVLSLAFKA